jgi:hypothetical protein
MRTNKEIKAIPESQRIYRYWVELRDLRDGSTRDLPLSAVKRIHLPRKKGDRQEPDQQLLRLQDNSVVLEGRDIEDIAAKLRHRYPDETHERFLHRERDYKSEQRKAEALDGLIELLAKAAVDELLREQEGESGDHRADQTVAV